MSAHHVGIVEKHEVFELLFIPVVERQTEMTFQIFSVGLDDEGQICHFVFHFQFLALSIDERKVEQLENKEGVFAQRNAVGLFFPGNGVELACAYVVDGANQSANFPSAHAVVGVDGEVGSVAYFDKRLVAFHHDGETNVCLFHVR